MRIILFALFLPLAIALGIEIAKSISIDLVEVIETIKSK